MKKTIVAFVVAVLVFVGIYYFIKSSSNDGAVIIGNQNVATTTITASSMVKENVKVENKAEQIIGTSAQGRNITAYHYGTGETELLFVGGIHGGYSWNTVLLAYDLMDYLKANPNTIPKNIKVTVIPVLNPDGLNKVVGTSSRFSTADVPESIADTVVGRFNSNNVDLSRNFDCDWQTNATWQNKDVSGGNTVFSEAESLAIKNYIEIQKPKAVVVWYSAAGGVYSSNCHAGILPETKTLTTTYSKASGYPAHEDFDFYATTGDMVNWLAKINVPAISVLLTNHTDIEWNKNLAGVKALLKLYTK